MSDKLALTIRATNGAAWETDKFHSNHKVAHVRDGSVKHFVKEGAMADGDYLLAHALDGQARELPDAQTLEDAAISDGAVLVLMARGPQVDG